jgi:ankyrin repeat protein
LCRIFYEKKFNLRMSLQGCQYQYLPHLHVEVVLGNADSVKELVGKACCCVDVEDQVMRNLLRMSFFWLQNYAVMLTQAGQTPFMYACALGKLEVANVLLAAGANPDRQDKVRSD